MNCNDTRRIICLATTGDATPRQSSAAERHLGQCDACRGFAALELPSLAGFRSAVPLAATELASIRKSVLARTAHTRTRPAASWRLALIAASLVTILFLVWRPAPRNTPVEGDPTAAASRISGINAAVDAPAPGTGIHPVPRAPHAASLVIAPPKTRAPRREPVDRVQVAANDEPPLPIRLEFQTDDPDVRIIWIANQTPPSIEDDSGFSAPADERHFDTR